MNAILDQGEKPFFQEENSWRSMDGLVDESKAPKSPPASRLARAVYALVAKYRFKLPGSTAACRADLGSQELAPRSADG